MLFFKKVAVPVSNETKPVDAVQLWEVEWHGREGDFQADLRKEWEVFTSQEAADTYAAGLRAAFKLLRIQGSTTVHVRKRG